MSSPSKSRVARRVACAVLTLSFAVSVFTLPIDEPIYSSDSIGHADYKIAEVAAAAKKGSKSTSVLFKGATIIAYDDKKDDLDIIRGGSLLITNDRIADVGKMINTPIPEGTEVVDVTGSIITPGFVDAHKHSWEHLYQTLGPNILVSEYYYKLSGFSKMTTHINPDDSYISTLMSLTDALNGGVTSVLDHAHGTFTPKHSDAMLKAHIDSGARVWNAYSIVPIPTVKNGKFFLDPTGQEPGGWKWKQLEQLAKEAPWANGRVQLGLGWESGRDQNEMRYGFDKASELNLSVVTLHTLDSGPYRRSVYQLDLWGYLNQSYPVIHSHGVSLDTNDLEILRRTNNFIAVTPESEHHYNLGQVRTNNLFPQAALGIDTSFTYSSDMLSQMRLQLQSTRLRMAQGAHSNFKFVNNTAMTVKQVFLLGTRNGGLALRRPDIGVIKKGAKADVVVFNTDNTATSAFYDPIAAVVMHSHVGNIEHVLVDGRWVKRDFKLVGLDWKEMKATFAKSARKIQKIYSEYDNDSEWRKQRTAVMFDFFRAKEEDFMNIPTVDVDPSVVTSKVRG
ncbi:MAG: hypothetical protein J3R72DRAFT_405427 [Linnemannia gamsii]|nr:MAG: hypothetical protein J3R72DRAFT_405427 [Linnemannia gamsii]